MGPFTVPKIGGLVTSIIKLVDDTIDDTFHIPSIFGEQLELEITIISPTDFECAIAVVIVIKLVPVVMNVITRIVESARVPVFSVMSPPFVERVVSVPDTIAFVVEDTKLKNPFSVSKDKFPREVDWFIPDEIYN